MITSWKWILLWIELLNTGYVKAMKTNQPQKLLEALKTKSLMERARLLNKSVKKNSITMKEICDIVRKVRKENAQRKDG